MTRCNDPKCPLNRHGVPHELHDVIENKPVTDSCNDPRCPMNRMGLPHNLHVEQYAPQQEAGREKKEGEEKKKEGKKKKENDEEEKKKKKKYAEQEEAWRAGYNPFFDESLFEKMTDDILNELGKKLYRDNPGQFHTHYTRNDPPAGDSGSHVFRGVPPSPKRPQRQVLSEEDRILRAKEPSEIFGVSKDVTLKEIKTRYRELAKKYDASKGIINKSNLEKERSNRIMVRINYAYAQLNKMYKSRV